MFDAVFAAPSVGAYSVEPLSISEIDAHPDRDRIWATLVAAQARTNSDIKEIEDENSSACNDAAEDAEESQRESDIGAIKGWASGVAADFEGRFKEPHGSPAVEWLLERISEAEDWL